MWSKVDNSLILFCRRAIADQLMGSQGLHVDLRLRVVEFLEVWSQTPIQSLSQSQAVVLDLTRLVPHVSEPRARFCPFCRG